MKISIALTTYNGEQFLREQLESFLRQTVLPFELCVGDDGSTDRTHAILEDFARVAPFPVKVTVNQDRLGFGRNFLETANRCAGDWIAFSDQDDVWLPAKLETCLAGIRAANDPDLLMVAHRATLVNARLEPTGGSIPEPVRPGLKGPLAHELTWAQIGFALVFRADLVHAFAGGPMIPTVFTDIDRYAHDVWVSSMANVLGKTLHIPDELCLYRRHDRTVTTTAKATSSRSAVAEARSIGAAYYRHKASVCRESAGCMRHYAAMAPRPDWTRRLIEGAEAYERLADALDSRAEIYRNRSFLTRAGTVARLLARGRYVGTNASAFGARALVKDSLAALVPGLFSESAAASPAA